MLMAAQVCLDHQCKMFYWIITSWYVVQISIFILCQETSWRTVYHCSPTTICPWVSERMTSLPLCAENYTLTSTPCPKLHNPVLSAYVFFNWEALFPAVPSFWAVGRSFWESYRHWWGMARTRNCISDKPFLRFVLCIQVLLICAGFWNWAMEDSDIWRGTISGVLAIV